MSSYYTKVCSIIIGEVFGDTIQTVADVLLSRGSTALITIIQISKLPSTCVQDALKSMCQHFIVSFGPDTKTLETVYYINRAQVLQFMRYPRYYVQVEKRAGPVAREILEEIVKTGLISISKLMYLCGKKVLTSNPNVNERVLLEQLMLFKNTVLGLAAKKYIIIIRPPTSTSKEDDEEDGRASPNTPSSDGNNSFVIPVVDLRLIMQKLGSSLNSRCGSGGMRLEELPDAKILWTINLSQLQSEIRDNIVCEALTRKFKAMIDPVIFRIIINMGFAKHTWENEGIPISFAQIKDKLDKISKPKSATTSKFLAEHLSIIEDDPKRLVTKLSNAQGGHFSFNMKTAVEEVVWGTIDRIITERHGFFALRIFRLVKQNGFVEQETINEMGMIPAKEAKHLTYKLVEDNFIMIKEIRKSYAANAPPAKIDHVFYVNLQQIVRNLRETCYKAIANLKQKAKIEKDKTKRLLVKQERITRILSNMAKKSCTEQQLNEIRELLTPPERRVLDRYHIQSGKLTSGAMHVDDTLFIFDIYMKYQKRTI